jgi:hypothetical protein
MANEWLKGQLTEAKRNSPMWAGFADALQQVFDEQVKPITERVASLNSYFTMHKDDLQKRLDELGSFFYFGGNLDPEDLPLAVMQKLDEVHFKRTDLPMQNAISREFQGLKVEWAALYAPRVITPEGSQDYTKKLSQGLLVNALRTRAEITDALESVSDYFLTSRGVLLVSLTQLAAGGRTTEEFSALVARIIYPLIPTDIVFDGERIVIHYDIIEPIERLFFFEQSLTQLFQAIHEPVERSRSSGITSQANIRLNNRLPEVTGYMNRIDAISLDFWPLDILT